MSNAKIFIVSGIIIVGIIDCVFGIFNTLYRDADKIENILFHSSLFIY